MNKLNMKQKAIEIAREAGRQTGLAMTADIMNHVPVLIESVEIDSEYIRQRVETELNRKTGNPINILLGLMGLRIVSTRRAAAELGLQEKTMYTIGVEDNDGHTESMLKLNENKLADASGQLADALFAVEESCRVEHGNLREQSVTVFGALDQKEQECAQLSADLQGQKNAVMEHTQYMLSLLGRNADSPIAEQLTEMLEDIGVRVFWDSEGAPFSDGAMFTELKCENPAARRMKPCLADETAVLLKGLRFVDKQAE